MTVKKFFTREDKFDFTTRSMWIQALSYDGEVMACIFPDKKSIEVHVFHRNGVDHFWNTRNSDYNFVNAFTRLFVLTDYQSFWQMIHEFFTAEPGEVCPDPHAPYTDEQRQFLGLCQ